MIMWLVVIASSIWVLFDAKQIGVRKGVVSGLGDMGPWAWFFVTLLLWIVGFPAYLYYRGKFKAALGTAGSVARVAPTIAPPAKSDSAALDDLEKLAVLKDRGLITDAEFNAKKQQLLGL